MLLLCGVLIILGLSWAGFNSDTKTFTSETPDPHNNQEETSQRPMTVSDAELAPDADLDDVVKNAVINMEKAKASGDMSLAMNEGVMKLLAVVKRDSNHIQAINYLGLFALESGQLEKAEKRFEKLLLLQPENKEFEKTLQEIRYKLENTP